MGCGLLHLYSVVVRKIEKAGGNVNTDLLAVIEQLVSMHLLETPYGVTVGCDWWRTFSRRSADPL